MTSLPNSSSLPDASDSDSSPHHQHYLVALYAVVLVVGLLGNTLVAAAIWNQKVVRNILLLNLCASDFLVCGLSVPISIAATVYEEWTIGLAVCKITFFLQGVPVAASTWSLMTLALDRYASIQHPRLLFRLRQDRTLPLIMIAIVWAVALAVCSPILYGRTMVGERCEEDWLAWRGAYVGGHVALVYLVPGLTVAACHHSVGHRLYAASLAAAAAQGDIPLPMPLLALGRPKEVIIIASVPNDASQKHQPGGGGEGGGPSRGGGRGPRHHRGARPRPRPPPPLTKQPSRQSLHSRRRLAQMLVALVVVFATCWLPYVTLRLYSLGTSSDPALIQHLLPFCLLLGHTHSAINPIVYWLMNRQSLQNTSCWAWLRLPSTRDSRLPGHEVDPRRPSSTNEAALGAFHPRFTVPKNRPRIYQPRESSQYYA